MSSADHALLADLLMLRRHLARALFEKLLLADECPLEAARSAVAEFEAELSEGPVTLERVVELDLAVVTALVAASDSVVLQLCFNPVAAVIRTQSRLAEAMFRDPQENVTRWRALIEALALRVPGLADTVVEALEAFDAQTLTNLDAEENAA